MHIIHSLINLTRYYIQKKIIVESYTVRGLRNDMHNIINQMGPSTPHFINNTSSEADNEESIFESTSVVSSVCKVMLL